MSEEEDGIPQEAKNFRAPDDSKHVEMPSNEEIVKSAESFERMETLEQNETDYGNSSEAEAQRKRFAEQIKEHQSSIQEKFLKGERLSYNEKWELMGSMQQSSDEEKTMLAEL